MSKSKKSRGSFQPKKASADTPAAAAPAEARSATAFKPAQGGAAAQALTQSQNVSVELKRIGILTLVVMALLGIAAAIVPRLL